MFSAKLRWFFSLLLATLLCSAAYIGLLRIIDRQAFQAICMPMAAPQAVANQTANHANQICYHQPQVLSEQAVTAIAVAANQQLVASSVRHTIQLWDAQTGQLQRSWQGHHDWITALAISSDQRFLASSSLDRTIKLWDLATGQLVKTLESGRVTSLQFNPARSSTTGLQLASGSRFVQWSDGVVSQPGLQLWDIATGKVIDRLGTGEITALQYSPDGQIVATVNQDVDLWQISTGQRLHHLKVSTAPSDPVQAVTFSRDGQRLISGSNKIKVWQVRSGELLQTIDFAASDLTLSQDGALLVAAIGDVITFWQLNQGKQLGLLPGSNYSELLIDFALNSQVLVTGSTDGLRLWRST